MNKDSITIIDFNDCEARRMKKEGLGGVRGFVKTLEGIIYVVKPEHLNQTLNEVMAQIIIKAIGLDSIEYAFIKMNECYYGALLYIDGLTLIKNKKYKSLNKQQKIDFLKHLFLNIFLTNEDLSGEIYLTKEDKIVSLDYGEAGISIPLLNLDKRDEEEKNILMSCLLKKTEPSYIMNYLWAYIGIIKKKYLDEMVCVDDLKGIVLSMLNSIADTDYSEYKTFLKTLMELHSELHACIYQEHLNGLIYAANDIRNNLDNIWKDMPAE